MQPQVSAQPPEGGLVEPSKGGGDGGGGGGDGGGNPRDIERMI